jgi:serine/threonine protein kinase
MFSGKIDFNKKIIMDSHNATEPAEAGRGSQKPSSSGSYGDIIINDDHVLKRPQSRSKFPYFVREMATLRLLRGANAPYVVHLMGVGDDGTLRLERYDGDLYDVEETALSTEDDVVKTVYRILVAMTNLQGLHLSHRDIKPENVLSSASGDRTALCDFGLCRYYPDRQQPAQCTPSVQTAIFRSPELLFAPLKDDDIEVDIGGVDPRNLDVWSLGLTALKLLNLDDFMPPHIAEGELTLEELYGVYQQYYGGDECDLRTYALSCPDISEFMTDFLLVVADMLTINSDYRLDPQTLLNNQIFDEYRSKDDIIDADSFNEERVQYLQSIIPEKETDALMRHRLTEIAHYHFNNVESARLAVCILYLLKDRGQLNSLGLEPDELTGLVTALAAAIFDTDVVDMSRSKASKVLKALDYDLLQPVNHPVVSQRLAKLFSTV